MAKNKKQQQTVKLSPENYIRQKARNLLIHECLINSDWEKVGTANIFVSRKHVNGNITAGVFFVDLRCLGVVETNFGFNNYALAYEELKKDLEKNSIMENIPYVLAHNIIYAAIEFADNLGFKPVKSFTNTTQYLLEEDTEDIELMDIKCGGDNGEPVYIISENDSKVKQNQIIAQLEKAVGKGNFTIVNVDDENFDEEYDDDNEFVGLPLEGQKQLFLEMTKNGLDDYEEEEQLKLIDLTDSIYLELCDEKEVDRLLAKWEPEITKTINKDNDFNYEFLGIDPSVQLTNDDRLEFNRMYNLISEKPKEAKKKLEKLQKKWGNIPFLCFNELNCLQLEKKSDYESKLNEYCKLYPNYPFLKIKKFVFNVFNSTENLGEHIPDFITMFGNRVSISSTEMYFFQAEKLLCILKHRKMEELDAMYNQLHDVNLDNDSFKLLKTLLLLERIKVLQEYFEKEQ